LLLVGAVVVVWFVLTYWVQILFVCAAVTGLWLLGLWGLRSYRASVLLAEQRRVCPVCGSWSGSVVLAEFDPSDAVLCPAHSARWGRIMGLEGKLFRGE